MLGCGGEPRAQPPSARTEGGAPGVDGKVHCGWEVYGLHDHYLESYRELLATPPVSRTRRTRA